MVWLATSLIRTLIMFQLQWTSECLLMWIDKDVERDGIV